MRFGSLNNYGMDMIRIEKKNQNQKVYGKLQTHSSENLLVLFPFSTVSVIFVKDCLHRLVRGRADEKGTWTLSA